MQKIISIRKVFLGKGLGGQRAVGGEGCQGYEGSFEQKGTEATEKTEDQRG